MLIILDVNRSPISSISQNSLRYSFNVSESIYCLRANDGKEFESLFVFYFWLAVRAGNVNSTTGDFNNVGTWGNYWASTVNNATNAHILNFNATNVNPTNNTTKVTGRSVRCVLEVGTPPSVREYITVVTWLSSLATLKD